MKAIGWTGVMLMLSVIAISSCNKHLSDAATGGRLIEVSAVGTESTLDVVTWNIENFPMHDSTIAVVCELVEDMDADIYALQEISSSNEFERLLDGLNGGPNRDTWDGALHEIATFLKTGVLYKSAMVELISQDHLFAGDGDASYDFAGRLPLEVGLVVEMGGAVFDFQLIVLHLKAQLGAATDVERRRDSVIRLAGYMDDVRADPGREQDYIMAGDWNDLLDDPELENIFWPLLSDTANFRFLTEPFAGSETEYSFIGGNFESLIDHLMITSSIDDVAAQIEAEVVKVDQEFTPYISEVSDHRPVAARMTLF